MYMADQIIMRSVESLIEHDPQKAVDDSRKNQRAAAAPRGTDERD